MTDGQKTFEGWVILEVMGHRKIGGYLREEQIAGAGFLRIDVPGKDGPAATQYYRPDSVYCLTPVAEDVARRFAAGCQPEPVTRWELPAAPALRRAGVDGTAGPGDEVEEEDDEEPPRG